MQKQTKLELEKKSKKKINQYISEQKCPESVQNLEKNKKELDSEEVKLEQYLQKLEGLITEKKVKTDQNIIIHSPNVKKHQNVKKYFDKEDVEKLKLSVKKQNRRMIYQQIISDKLRIEIRKELQEKLNSKKVVCKSREEFAKRERRRKHQENVKNLEENKKKLEKKEVELEKINRLLSKIPPIPQWNRKLQHLKYERLGEMSPAQQWNTKFQDLKNKLSQKPGGKSYSPKRKRMRLFLREEINNCKLKISIRIKANNIFCTLGNLSSKRTLIVKSAGKYGIKVSKRNLRVSFKNVLKLFLREIKKKVKKKYIIIEIISPTHIRKQLINFILKNLSK